MAKEIDIGKRERSGQGWPAGERLFSILIEKVLKKVDFVSGKRGEMEKAQCGIGGKRMVRIKKKA